MNLNSLKKFAQGARRTLLAEVASRLDYVLGHDDVYVRSHQGEIGLDIAAIAYKRLVDKIVLIFGDSDFVPAAPEPSALPGSIADLLKGTPRL